MIIHVLTETFFFHMRKNVWDLNPADRLVDEALRTVCTQSLRTDFFTSVRTIRSTAAGRSPFSSRILNDETIAFRSEKGLPFQGSPSAWATDYLVQSPFCLGWNSERSMRLSTLDSILDSHWWWNSEIESSTTDLDECDERWGNEEKLSRCLRQFPLLKVMHLEKHSFRHQKKHRMRKQSMIILETTTCS